MRKLFLLLSMFTSLCEAQTTVFFFEQQSNSTGGAINTTLDTSLSHPINNCLFWDGTAFTQLAPANCQYPYRAGTSSGAQLELMKKYQEYYGGTVYAIMYSVVGTPLYDNGTTASFYPGRKGTYFDYGISTINSAMAYMWNTLKITNYKFIFIPQGGENDAAVLVNANAYRTNLTSLISGWQKNITCSAYAASEKIVIIPKISFAQGLNATNTGIIQAACDSVAANGLTGIKYIASFSQDSCQWAGLHHTALGYKQEADVIYSILISH